MDCTIPRFTVSCNRSAVSCDLLRFGCISSDLMKCKGTPCVQGIEYAAQNRQKRKKPCAAFNTQHGAFLCCRFLLASTPLFSCHALCKVVIEPVLDACHVAVGAVGINGVEVVVDGNIPHAVLRKRVVDIKPCQRGITTKPTEVFLVITAST